MSMTLAQMSEAEHEARMEQIRRIWADVLLLDPEDIEDGDDFFELGGDSVKAIQLLGRVSEHGVDVDLDTLYQNRTLEGFSRSTTEIQEQDEQNANSNGSIHEQNTEPNGHAGPEVNGNALKKGFNAAEIQDICGRMGIASDAIVKTAPITPSQEWLLEFSLQGGMILANSVYEVEGDDIESGLAQLVELLEAKIPIFRSTIVEVEVGSGKEYVQVLLKKGSSLWIRTSDLDAYLETTFTEKMKLGGSPIQYAVVTNDKAHGGKTFFVISVQHSFFDVFSRSVLEGDILQALRSPGEYARAPERPWYGDFASGVRALPGRGAALRRYWTAYLDGARYDSVHPPGLARRGPPGLQDGVLQWSRLGLPASAPAQAQAQARQTPLVLAAWALALARLSGLRDVVFGLARHGRSRALRDARRTIGPFLSLTPLRLRLGGGGVGGVGGGGRPETVGELVRRVQDEILSTSRWEQGDIPGVYPDDEGSPWVQTWVNVKSELYTMGSGYRDDEGGGPGGKITRFVPRSDLHPLWMKSHWAVCLLIYLKQDGVEVCAGYQTSLIGHERASGLFGDFKELVKVLASGEDDAVDALLA